MSAEENALIVESVVETPNDSQNQPACEPNGDNPFIPTIPSSEEKATTVDVLESSTAIEVDMSQTDLKVHLPSETTVNRRFDWTCSKPKEYVRVIKEFERYAGHLPLRNNYLRGCHWSPDGTCLLTNSCDNVFRIFEFPPALDANPNEFDFDGNAIDCDQLSPVLWMREHELVYDYAWFPLMQSTNPITCSFASTSRRTPVHLWDAFTGTLRASYRPFNHMGESIAAQSLAFSGDGERLYCGFSRFIQIFHVNRPGSQSERRPKLGKRPDQGGIISCLTALCNAGPRNFYASGSFCGSVGVYAEPGKAICIVDGPQSGVSQVAFSTPLNSGSPWYLIAGGRVDSQIFVWDGRWMSEPLVVLHRRVENYQRFQFGVDPSGRFIFTGNQTGAISVFDLTSPTVGTGEKQPASLFPVAHWRAHVDSCHGLSVHPFLPVIATTSGQKRLSSARKVTKRAAPSMASSTKRLCERCKVAEVLEESSGDGDGAGSGGDSCCSSSDSELETEQTLTEEELNACCMSAGAPLERLPLEGQLTRLPIRNELAVWSFPRLPEKDS